MSITESDHQTDGWMNLNLDNDLQPESDKICDPDNCEMVSEAARPDFLSQAEKGDGIDLLPECRKEEYKPEPEKGDYKTESEKGDFRTESEESDLDSERSLTGLEMFDRLNDIQTSDFQDGATESDFPVHVETVKDSETISRFRGSRDSGLAATALTTNQSELRQTDEAALNKIEDKSCKRGPFSNLTSGNALRRADATFGDWIWYLAPKTVCLVVVSLIYLGFSLLGIRIWGSSSGSA
ncbi:hypothetical protein BsWGS_04299 [Bradybaena similaris]